MKTRHLLLPLVAAALIGACGGGGGISGTGMQPQPGTLRLSLTDAPACGYDAVDITVQKVRVNQSASAAETDAGWHEIVLAPAQRVDLLGLTNGVLKDLGRTELPAGRYTQLRLVLADNSAGDPLANAVTPSGGAKTALSTPSGQQSGLKIDTDIVVPEGQVADFVIDFDACKSIVRRGNSGQYNLKPVLHVTPLLADAGLRVGGLVDPAVALLPGVSVSLQLAGVPVKATTPDPLTGRFLLYPLPAGSYDLVVSAPGRATAVLTGVPVASGVPTAIGTSALPLLPPRLAQPARAVGGTLSPPTATIRALQTLTAGPTVEVAWGAVDAATGDFAFALPVDAPVRAAYSAAGFTGFVPDAAAAAHYTLQAVSAGVAKTALIDASAPVPSVTISFP